MNPESEDQRNNRIRDAQMRDRSHGASEKSHQSVNAKKRSGSKPTKRLARTTHPGKSLSTTLSDLLPLPPGGMRDVVLGIALGLIPALLVIIVLPGMLKFLALLVLGIAGTAGYLLGDAPAR